MQSSSHTLHQWTPPHPPHPPRHSGPACQTHPLSFLSLCNLILGALAPHKRRRGQTSSPADGCCIPLVRPRSRSPVATPPPSPKATAAARRTPPAVRCPLFTVHCSPSTVHIIHSPLPALSCPYMNDRHCSLTWLTVCMHTARSTRRNPRRTCLHVHQCSLAPLSSLL